MKNLVTVALGLCIWIAAWFLNDCGHTTLAGLSACVGFTLSIVGLFLE